MGKPFFYPNHYLDKTRELNSIIPFLLHMRQVPGRAHEQHMSLLRFDQWFDRNCQEHYWNEQNWPNSRKMSLFLHTIE